jgi:hypothetical protein
LEISQSTAAVVSFTGDAAFNPAAPQDLKHSRANTNSNNAHNTQHPRAKHNLLCFMPKDTQPSQTCSSGFAPNSVGTRKSPSYLARRHATTGLQLAAVMVTRIRIIQRCTRGGSPPHRLCGEPLLHIVPYGPWQLASVRNVASFFVHLVSVRFSCGE